MNSNHVFIENPKSIANQQNIENTVRSYIKQINPIGVYLSNSFEAEKLNLTSNELKSLFTSVSEILRKRNSPVKIDPKVKVNKILQSQTYFKILAIIESFEIDQASLNTLNLKISLFIGAKKLVPNELNLQKLKLERSLECIRIVHELKKFVELFNKISLCLANF